MGCIQSSQRVSRSPVTHSPVTNSASPQHEARTAHHSPQSTGTFSSPRSTLESEQIPSHAQNVMDGIRTTPAKWQSYIALGQLSQEVNTLCSTIENASAAASLTPLYKQAVKLRDDLDLRTHYIEGHSPQHYLERLDSIRRCFDATVSASPTADHASDLNDRVSFRVASAPPHSDPSQC